MYQGQYPVGAFSQPEALAGASKLAFLRKVYGLLTTSVVAAAGGAMVALYAGTGASAATVDLGDGAVATIPPLVALFSGGWLSALLGFALMFGAFMLAGAVRHKPGVNLLALHGAAFVSGVYIAPMIFFAMLMASTGHTLSASPVRDAFLLAVGGFGGLSAYTLITKKDFSFLRGFLTMGFFVVFIGLLISMFLQSGVFQLAVASAGVLLFGGYILYDTSKLLRSSNDDPIGATIQLFLDFFNLFIMLLSILSSRRN